MNTLSRLLRHKVLPVTLLLLLVSLAGAAGLSAAPNRAPDTPVDYNVTTPREFFGYDIGQDYKLTPWQTHELTGEGVRQGLVEYAYKLQDTSPRVRVFQYGTTELGRPMIMTVVTSPANWAQIDNLKGILRKLADPRQVASDDEARFLASQGKAVYWMSPAIHSTERTSPEVIARLGYRLASSNDAWTLRLLDNVIVVLEGTINPDGLDLVTDWYYQYKDTPYAASNPPYYGKYINHDNNRDFLGQQIAETRANTAARFEWNPTVYHDLHEAQDFLYMSPGPDPTNPAVNSITVAEWLGYAGHTLQGLIAKGWKGAFTYDYSDNWYPGYNDGFSFMHNTMGIYYELQGADRATPRTFTRPQGTHTVRTWYNPAPYTVTASSPITWHLMDAVNFEEDALRQELDYLSQNKSELLFNFYQKAKTNMQKAAGEAPYAFIIPQNGGDNADVTDMVNNLRAAQHIEVNRLGSPLAYQNRTYQPGDYVVMPGQPYGLTAKNFLATPPYPNLKTPYDVVSWDYGLMRDVQVITMTVPLTPSISLIPVTATVPYVGSLTGAPADHYIIEHQSNNNLARLLPQLWANAAFTVTQADASFTALSRTFPPGTFVINTEDTQQNYDWLKDRVLHLGLTAWATDETLTATVQLRQPRVGIYTPNNSTTSTMPEGWVRLRLDQAGFPYTRLYKSDITTPTLAGLDVVIVPDMTPSTLINGSSSSSLPPAYRGGITSGGVTSLKAWVQNGGELVLMGRATRFPMDSAVRWDIGVSLGTTQQNMSARWTSLKGDDVDAKDASEGQPPEHNVQKPDPTALAAGALYSPGSVVRILVDPTARDGYGYDVEQTSWLDDTNTPCFLTTSGTPKIVASYPSSGPLLLSGYIENGANIQGKAAIVDAPLGAGRVVLLGPNTTYRGQMTGAFMFFWNALIEGGRATDGK